MTRLGDGFGTQPVINADALERTAAAIAGMVGEAKQHGVVALAAVGTAGLRIAANADEAIAAIRSRTGVQVEVVSGEDEGRLAYLAAKSGLGTFTGSLVVFDTGGGSSQFSFGHDSIVDERFSVEVGAVRYTERFKLDGVVSPDTLREAMAAMSADLSRIDGRAVPDALVAMGGVVTNMTAVLHRLATYDPAVVHGTVLHHAEIDRQIELYRSMDAAAPALDRRPAAQARRRHPRRRLHRAHGDGQAGQGQPHGQRSRPAPRRSGRALRGVNR